MRNYTEQTGVAFLTADQRTWLELRKRLRQVRPSKRPNESPDSDWKSWCYKRATHKHGWWQRGMTVLLMLHGFLLLLEYHPSPAGLDTVRSNSALFFPFYGIAMSYLEPRFFFFNSHIDLHRQCGSAHRRLNLVKLPQKWLGSLRSFVRQWDFCNNSASSCRVQRSNFYSATKAFLGFSKLFRILL